MSQIPTPWPIPTISLTLHAYLHHIYSHTPLWPHVCVFIYVTQVNEIQVRSNLHSTSFNRRKCGSKVEKLTSSLKPDAFHEKTVRLSCMKMFINTQVYACTASPSRGLERNSKHRGQNHKIKYKDWIWYCNFKSVFMCGICSSEQSVCIPKKHK